MEGQDNEKTILQDVFSVGKDGVCTPWETGRVRKGPDSRE